jgi:peptidoglycan/LPS O-acetylase OafA/YrhL
VQREPVFEPPPGNPRFLLFDSIRGILVLMVCVVHAAYLSGALRQAWYGDIVARLEFCLPVFFLVSAFLLYRPFVAARLDGTPRPGTLDFYRKRALRILPAYWLALTLLTLWPGLPQLWGDHPWVYYGFLQVYDPSWAFGGILPAWSLDIEVTFYVLLPLMAVFMRRASRGSTRAAKVRFELTVIGALYALGLLWRAVVENGVERSNSAVYLTLPGGLEWVMLGMALAVASAALHGRPEQPALVRLVTRAPGIAWGLGIALFAVATYGLGLSATSPHLGIHLVSTEHLSGFQWLAEGTLYGLMAVLLLLPAVFGDHAGGLPRRILRNRVLGYLGMISYGVFLWHLPLMAWLSNGHLKGIWGHAPMLGILAMGLALAVVAATLSYYLVERPLLQLKHRRRAPRHRPGGRAAPSRYTA